MNSSYQPTKAKKAIFLEKSETHFVQPIYKYNKDDVKNVKQIKER